MYSVEGRKNLTVNIEDEMQKSYMEYAMSVIVGRALPDVRDGLKPVHRRVLFAMYDLGNYYNKPYKKSARVVGDVIGKYHPHGDTAVYDTIVRMAQDFSLRYPLVDGQGNFGSIDGDNAAAMRYTEVRLSRIASEMLADIDKETVDFKPNYDDSLVEPSVMPNKIPNLLLSGSSGIAVGMATNIPPHNLVELVDGIIHLIDNPDATVADLMQFIKAPDFPTAGIIYGTKGIKAAYETGRGIIKMRARTSIETTQKGDRSRIIVTEIPYQVNKSRLIEKIADLANDKKIEGISDLRDESSRQGMRIVIELKRGEIPQIIINKLIKHTQMEMSFGIIMLAIVNGRPEILNLKQVLVHFISHRKEVITRKCRYELRKAEEKEHILLGLKIAIENLDEVVKTIKESKNPQEAKEKLVLRFKMSVIQAQAVLDMRLHRLTGLEREKILEDLKNIQKEIKRLKAILADERLVLDIIVAELKEIKDKFGDERRTELIEDTSMLTIEDLIADEDMVITITRGGYIKRNPISIYRSQRRGGKGLIGAGTKEEDFVDMLFIASAHQYILCFSDAGKIYWLKVHELPQAGRTSLGKAIVNLLHLSSDENITAILPVKEFTEDKFVLLVTKQGTVKKTDLMAFSRPRSGGIIAVTLDEGDSLIGAHITDGKQYVFLSTTGGKAIKFAEEEIRPTGRSSKGVRGIRLMNSDIVVSSEVISVDTNAPISILSMTENGYGKRTDINDYPVQKRAGQGVITIDTKKRNGKVIATFKVSDEDELMIITDGGKLIRMSCSGISVIGRNTKGVRLIKLDNGEKVVGADRIIEKEER
jgi:DNA gyrase subunit A